MTARSLLGFESMEAELDGLYRELDAAYGPARESERSPTDEERAVAQALSRRVMSAQDALVRRYQQALMSAKDDLALWQAYHRVCARFRMLATYEP